MRIPLISAAGLALLAACAADARPNLAQAPLTIAKPAAYGAVLRCEAQITPERGSVRVQAVVSGSPGFHGDYEFKISKSGPNGSADTDQGGAVELSSDRPLTLNSNIFNLSRGDRLRARLIVRNDIGEVCRDEVRL
jgi:hypothetical protein